MSKVLPGRTFDCQLDEFTIKLRVLSGEDGERVNELVKQSAGSPTPEQRDELYGLCIAAWPWEGSIRSVLNDTECWRLIGACLEGSSLTADERKKFGSQSWWSERKSATTAQSVN